MDNEIYETIDSDELNDKDTEKAGYCCEYFRDEYKENHTGDDLYGSEFEKGGYPPCEKECVEKYNKSCPIILDKCQDFREYDLGPVELSSQGRLLELKLTLKNICPGRRVALAVILKELDCKNDEHPRGFKTFVIPAHYDKHCRDICVKCIRFVLPERLDDKGFKESICDSRKFIVRTTAHYIDTNINIKPDC